LVVGIVHHRSLDFLNSLDFNEISKWMFGPFVDSEDSLKSPLPINYSINPTTSAIDIPKVFFATFRDLTRLAVASTRWDNLGSCQIKFVHTSRVHGERGLEEGIVVELLIPRYHSWF
jgi:hypothetical protein